MNCACGSEKPFTECCGPYLAGEPAPTPEALMRARYTAYVHHEIDYLLATHAPETALDVDREATDRWARESTWLGLKILDVKGGGPGENEGEVEFVARWRQGKEEAAHHERSLFRRGEDGRWLYVSGHTPKRAPARREATPSPNAPCPCGSGRKYKRCHGL